MRGKPYIFSCFCIRALRLHDSKLQRVPSQMKRVQKTATILYWVCLYLDYLAQKKWAC